MHVLYEDDGGFKAGTILSEADASLQVESASGKRSKIKASSVVLKFASPEPTALLQQAEAAAADLDLSFLWECAPPDEFGIADLAAEYHGHNPSALEQAALLLRVHGAPVYFHRRGKGRYRPAPPEILQAALAAVEKKRLQAEQQQAWADDMLAGTLPESIARQVDMLAFRPDKNSQEWKALEIACNQGQITPIRLLLKLGAWPHPLALLRRRFLLEHFPKGVEHAPTEIPTDRELPLSDAKPYSFDDITTTEIDDALSVVALPDGRLRVGVHIAAPALAATRDSPLDKIARNRMSTVYMPGDKIPMQPDELIAAYSLDAGRPVPALSLYATVDTETGEVSDTDTRLERIVVQENLRVPDLEAQVTEAALEDDSTELPYGELLRPLWRAARALGKVRETVRGKPELFTRVEYSFYVDGNPHDPAEAHVRIVPRGRGAPLDRLVAEFMILANSRWGGILAEHGVPALYRSQQPMGRVRMSTHALPHESIGVPQYAWCTSPLRRYIDLVNQQQLIAVAEHGISARLAAPYKPKDADLFGIISGFEAQYAAYNEFQDNMERYWCLRWLQQENVTRTGATVLREDLVRLDNIPLVTRVPDMPQLERGQQVLLDIIGMDELDLSLECRYVGLSGPLPEPQEAAPEVG